MRNPLTCNNFMAHKEFKNLDYQLKKKDNFRIRVTTHIQGDLKNSFMCDCIRRGITEADLARDIFDVYYMTLRNAPHIANREIPEIKNWIIDNIKFKP